MLKYAAAFVVLLAAGPVFAQGAAQSPPASGSASSEPQSSNSLPPGAANMNLNSTANPSLAGSAIGTTTTAQPPVMGTTPRP